MADNVAITAGAGTNVAADEAPYSGDTVKVQLVRIVHVTGPEGTKVVGELVKAEDAAHASGDFGLQMLAVRQLANVALAGSDLDYAPLQVTPTGALKCALTEDEVGSAVDTEDGSVAAGAASVALTIPLPYTFNGAVWVRGGLTPFKRVSTADTNAAVVKAAAGIVGFIQASNVNAAVRYLKLYNKATPPVVGTDVPAHTFLLPLNQNTVIPLPEKGLAFSLGIAMALTTEATDAGATGVSANEHVVNLGYL